MGLQLRKSLLTSLIQPLSSLVSLPLLIGQAPSPPILFLPAPPPYANLHNFLGARRELSSLKIFRIFFVNSDATLFFRYIIPWISTLHLAL